MEINNKILKYGLLLIVLSLIFTIGFAAVFSLKDPVFLEKYMEQNVSNGENIDIVEIFDLKYITNISDNRRIIGIDFEDIPNIETAVSYWPYGGVFSFFNSFNNQRGVRFGRYVLHTLYLRIDLNNMDKEFYEIELNNAKISFDDGSTLDSDLGRIILYKDESISGDLQTISSSGSSDGTSTSQKVVTKDIKLLDISSPLLADLEGYFDLTIDNIDYREISGMQYETSNYLNTYSKFKAQEDAIAKYTHYDIEPKLYFEDEDGNVSYTRIYLNHIPYHFDSKGLFKYLRARGVI